MALLAAVTPMSVVPARRGWARPASFATLVSTWSLVVLFLLLWFAMMLRRSLAWIMMLRRSHGLLAWLWLNIVTMGTYVAILVVTVGLVQFYVGHFLLKTINLLYKILKNEYLSLKSTSNLQRSKPNADLKTQLLLLAPFLWTPLARKHLRILLWFQIPSLYRYDHFSSHSTHIRSVLHRANVNKAKPVLRPLFHPKKYSLREEVLEMAIRPATKLINRARQRIPL